MFDDISENKVPEQVEVVDIISSDETETDSDTEDSKDALNVDNVRR